MYRPEFIIVHHTGGTDLNPRADTSGQTYEIVDNYHKSLGWGKIGYHYFIDKTGLLTQGRYDNQEGAHTIGYNTKSLGICLAGNFDVTLPTEAQIQTLTKLLNNKCQQYDIPLKNIVPHRFAANKTCYGKLLSDDFARKLVTVKSAKSVILETIDSLKKQVEALS